MPPETATQNAAEERQAAGNSGCGGLIVLPDLSSAVNRDLIIALAARYGVPAIYYKRAYAESGGLIAYGDDHAEEFRQAAGYIDRILKGARPQRCLLHCISLVVAQRGSPATSASLIGRPRSSAFRLSAGTVSMSLAGSRFSSDSAPGPFQHGIRRRGGTIFCATLPSR